MRYILHPGYIMDKEDRYWHFINAEKLAALYGLHLKDCVVMCDTPRGQLGFETQDGDIHLHVRYNGDYRKI